MNDLGLSIQVKRTGSDHIRPEPVEEAGRVAKSGYVFTVGAGGERVGLLEAMRGVPYGVRVRFYIWWGGELPEWE